MLKVSAASGFGARSFDPAASGDQGTWSASSTDLNHGGFSNTTDDFFGLYFVANGNGTIATVQVNVKAHNAAASGVIARLYTDNSGSPGTQVGTESGGVNFTGTGAFTFTFSTPPSITFNTGYWMVIDGSADSSFDERMTTVAADASNHKTGGASTATGISDGSGNFSTEEVKMEIVPS